MSLCPNSEVDTFLPLTIHWRFWQFLGLQLPKRDSKWFMAYIMYAIILNISLLLFPISLLINLALSKNMSELCENICNTTTSVITVCKLYYTPVVRLKLCRMSTILHRLDARARTPQEVNLLKESTASSRKLIVIFAIIVFCYIVICEIMSYFAKERILAIPTWFPWDWKASRRNHIYAHWCIVYALIGVGTITTTVDTYPPACFIILSAQIKALASRIENLGNEKTSTEEKLYQELAHCIEDHNNIHKLFDNIQQIISTTCLFQFAATGISQCTLGVYMIYVGMNPFKLLHIFIYFVAVTVQIFLLCYYGDLYCQANDHLTESIYSSNWTDRDVKFQKAFLLLLQRSQVPSTIRAGNLIPVQMPTFVKIIKTAYSVFTVLNNTN